MGIAWGVQVRTVEIFRENRGRTIVVRLATHQTSYFLCLQLVFLVKKTHTMQHTKDLYMLCTHMWRRSDYYNHGTHRVGIHANTPFPVVQMTPTTRTIPVRYSVLANTNTYLYPCRECHGHPRCSWLGLQDHTPRYLDYASNIIMALAT